MFDAPSLIVTYLFQKQTWNDLVQPRDPRNHGDDDPRIAPSPSPLTTDWRGCAGGGAGALARCGCAGGGAGALAGVLARCGCAGGGALAGVRVFWRGFRCAGEVAWVRWRGCGCAGGGAGALACVRVRWRGVRRVRRRFLSTFSVSWYPIASHPVPSHHWLLRGLSPHLSEIPTVFRTCDVGTPGLSVAKQWSICQPRVSCATRRFRPPRIQGPRLSNAVPAALGTGAALGPSRATERQEEVDLVRDRGGIENSGGSLRGSRGDEKRSTSSEDASTPPMLAS